MLGFKNGNKQTLGGHRKPKLGSNEQPHRPWDHFKPDSLVWNRVRIRHSIPFSFIIRNFANFAKISYSVKVEDIYFKS